MPNATSFDIRQVPSDDPAAFMLSIYAFSSTPRQPTDEDKQTAQFLADMKLFMAFDGDTALAQVGVFPMTMNVRGTVLPMGGITGVATMPAGRRGGRIRALMTHALSEMRNDGQPISTLYPFKESFYERLGYISMPCPMYLSINPADLAPIMRLTHTATIEHTSIADGFDEWVQFLHRFQHVCNGFSLHSSTQQSAKKSRNQWWLTLVREGDEVTGAMTYKILGEHKPMHVKTFFSTTIAARYRLLEWLGRHVDQVPNVQIPVLPGDEPELWWHDMSDTISSSGMDAWGAPMARIVSLDALSGIPVGDGEVTVNITDDHASWNAGAWTLRRSNGQLEVSSGGNATATITIQGLSSLLFNGTDPAVLPWRGWGEIDETTANHLRNLFPPARPYLYEQF